jgi:hypothetical protein
MWHLRGSIARAMDCEFEVDPRKFLYHPDGPLPGRHRRYSVWRKRYCRTLDLAIIDSKQLGMNGGAPGLNPRDRQYLRNGEYFDKQRNKWRLRRELKGGFMAAGLRSTHSVPVLRFDIGDVVRVAVKSPVMTCSGCGRANATLTA